MPWRQATEVLERTRFVLEAERGEWTMAELCRRYGVSRKTGYYWVRRYQNGGLAELESRSRRPHHNPRATAVEVVERVLEERRRHPHWGPRKLLERLKREAPELRLPARSTAAGILKRAGLVKARRRRRGGRFSGRVGLGEAEAANALWTTDYKGQFRLGDGALCYPLTIQDRYSRYLLACEGQRSVRAKEARRLFERVFREYGLPDRIGSDNGTPFGSTALGGLSRLGVWWLKLGIRLERIEPGHPEQNGGHERLHRTLNEEAIPRRPPCPDAVAQQDVFDRFRTEYNEERPHEALDGCYPADCYQPSWRPYLEQSPGLDYPAHFERRQVRKHGAIKWQGRLIYLTEVLSGEPIGLEEVDDGVWALYFGPLLLGKLVDGETKLRPGAPRAGSVASSPPSRE